MCWKEYNLFFHATTNHDKSPKHDILLKSARQKWMHLTSVKDAFSSICENETVPWTVI